MRAKAADLDLAAAAKTVGVQPAADQVAAAIAAILLSHAQIYQDISTQMA
ncbi:PE domain-containing protein, partial [Streptococcus pyogenes]